jgi:DNA-binding NtrC family response regulator
LPEAVLEAEPAGSAAASAYRETLRETKKRLILEAVGRASGNTADAAKILGVQVNYLHRLIRNLDLRPLLKPRG